MDSSCLCPSSLDWIEVPFQDRETLVNVQACRSSFEVNENSGWLFTKGKHGKRFTDLLRNLKSFQSFNLHVLSI